MSPRGVPCPRCEGARTTTTHVTYVSLDGTYESEATRTASCPVCNGTGTASLFVRMGQGPGEIGRTWKERVDAGEDA